jgi:hypothetical protein
MSVDYDTKLSGLAAQVLREAVEVFEVDARVLAASQMSMFAGRWDMNASFSAVTGSFPTASGSFPTASGPFPVVTGSFPAANGTFRVQTGSLATTDGEPDEGMSLKKLFGLGAKLSPVRLLPAAELAAHARIAPLMRKLEALASWLGEGRLVDSERELSAADAVEAGYWAGVSRDYLPRLWGYALTAGWIELVDEPGGERTWAVLGDTGRRWSQGDDSGAMRVWAVVFAAVLSQAIGVAASWDQAGARKLNFEGRGVVVAMMLFLARQAGLSLADVEDLVIGGTIGERPSSRAAKRAWDGWVRTHGDPTRLLVSELSALEAVAVPEKNGGVVRLTPLAMWALREQVIRDGVKVPVLSTKMAEISAPSLVSMADGVGEAEFAEDLAAWLASRGPERGADELLAFAVFGRVRARLVAVSLVHRIGVAALGAWRDSMQNPELCGYARIALSAMAAELPKSALPKAIEPRQEDLARVAGDLLEVGFRDAAPDPGDIAAKFGQVVPEGAEVWLIGLMSRSPHPQVIQVLTVLGRCHPDRKIAKAARRSGRRARRAWRKQS